MTKQEKEDWAASLAYLEVLKAEEDAQTRAGLDVEPRDRVDPVYERRTTPELTIGGWGDIPDDLDWER